MNDFTPTIIEDIEVVKLTQSAVAQVLAMAIIRDMNAINWKLVNAAIVKRWKGGTARARILTEAWKIVEQAKLAALKSEA